MIDQSPQPLDCCFPSYELPGLSWTLLYLCSTMLHTWEAPPESLVASVTLQNGSSSR